MPEPRPAALIVTHGALGHELLRTVERIVGPQAEVQILSNEGLSAEGLTAAHTLVLVEPKEPP